MIHVHLQSKSEKRMIWVQSKKMCCFRPGVLSSSIAYMVCCGVWCRTYEYIDDAYSLNKYISIVATDVAPFLSPIGLFSNEKLQQARTSGGRSGNANSYR